MNEELLKFAMCLFHMTDKMYN